MAENDFENAIWIISELNPCRGKISLIFSDILTNCEKTLFL